MLQGTATEDLLSCSLVFFSVDGLAINSRISEEDYQEYFHIIGIMPMIHIPSQHSLQLDLRYFAGSYWEGHLISSGGFVYE